MNYNKSVEEFHKLFDMNISNKPVLAANRSELRYSLIQEELDEFRESCEKNDLVGVLDALCDLQYVLSGTIVEFGLQEVFDRSFEEVHTSNMSKACLTFEQAERTQQYYQTQKQTASVIETKMLNHQQIWLVKRLDGKLLKNIDYQPANLERIIHGS